MIEPLVDSWLTNSAATIYLLDSLSPEQWEAAAPEAKPIRSQFAHVHNVRLMVLKMSDRSLLGEMHQADRRKGSRDDIRAALLASAEAFVRLIASAGSPDAKIKGLHRTVTSVVCSGIAHEGYHRGQVELILRQCGLALEDEKILQLWDPSKMAKLARSLHPEAMEG